MKKWIQLAVVALFLVVVGSSHAQPVGSILTCSSAAATTPVDLVLLTIPTGQITDGDSVNWLSVSNTRHSVNFQYIITGTATVELFNSLDSGATWDAVANTSNTGNELYVVEHPVGHYKATVSGIAAGNVKVQARCGVSEGGRP